MVRFFLRHGFWPGYALLLLGAALILETGLGDSDVRRRLRIAASGFAAILVAAPLLAAGLPGSESGHAPEDEPSASSAPQKSDEQVQ